ncbi:MAG: hypothetical protein IKD14_01175 [Clostridia bacterium]|nr:hypothetical protein [Clostridia bacterium]
MDDKSNKVPAEREKVASSRPKKDILAKKAKYEATSREFKNRYFAYYDDIKISDREDW